VRVGYVEVRQRGEGEGEREGRGGGQGKGGGEGRVAMAGGLARRGPRLPRVKEQRLPAEHITEEEGKANRQT